MLAKREVISMGQMKYRQKLFSKLAQSKRRLRKAREHSLLKKCSARKQVLVQVPWLLFFMGECSHCLQTKKRKKNSQVRHFVFPAVVNLLPFYGHILFLALNTINMYADTCTHNVI